jgi:hypothetical protein
VNATAEAGSSPSKNINPSAADLTFIK